MSRGWFRASNRKAGPPTPVLPPSAPATAAQREMIARLQQKLGHEAWVLPGATATEASAQIGRLLAAVRNREGSA